MNKKHRGLLMVTCASFVWGTSLVAQSMGMEHMGPFTFSAVRFFVGGLVVLLPSFWGIYGRATERACTHVDSQKVSRQLWLAGICCGVVLFVAISMQQVGICHTTVGKAGFITAMYIIIVPLLDVFLGKRISRAVWVCIAIAMAGMYLLCIDESLQWNIGDIYIFFCAVATAIHILCIDYFAPKVNAFQLTCIQFFVCCVLSASIAIVVEQPSMSALGEAWGALFYTGVISCGVAYTCQVFGQRDINPIIASLVYSLEAVFAALAGWLILGEVLTSKEFFGCVLLFTALMAAQSPELLKKIGGLLGQRSLPN